MANPKSKAVNKSAIYVWDIPSKTYIALDSGLFNASAGLVTVAYDYIKATYPDTVTEVYTFKTGGSSGTTVATVTVVYTDTTKEFIDTVTKS